MEILVFGAGSIGSLIGGLLAVEHEVTLVGRDPHMACVANAGLMVSGEYSFTVQPTAVTEVTGYEGDLAIVTVKAYDTESAARALQSCSVSQVLSLQNGMGNEAILARELSGTVLAGTITYGAVIDEPGRVECTGTGTVTIGPYTGTLESAGSVVDAFNEADVHTALTADTQLHLWQKLAVNTGINPVTALARVPNGALSHPGLHSIAGRAARETARVARDNDVDLRDDMAVRSLETVIENTANNTSSMQQDVLAVSRTEIDALNGYVVGQASRPVPTNRTLTALIAGWEENLGLR